MYGAEKDTAMNFYPAGKLEAWLRADRKAPFPSYMTAAENQIRNRIMALGGYLGPTNWYRMRFGQRLGVEEEKSDNLDPRIPCPALYIEQASSSVVRLPYLWEQTAKFADRCVNKRVTTENHWVQLEAKDEVNQMLEEFLEAQ